MSVNRLCVDCYGAHGGTAALQLMLTNRGVEVSQVAALVAFLCSTKANSITGALLPIDGGWTAH
jgi:NAD(P)-dependent dehydrogenase (short-subunit alcohol dehydrogenase family)